MQLKLATWNMAYWSHKSYDTESWQYFTNNVGSDILLFQEAFPNIVVGGTAYHVWNIVHLFLVFFLAIWVYAAIRPRFGPGPKSALITSFVLWSMYFLFVMNFARLGIFPLNLAIVSLAFNFVEIPAAILVGAKIYSEPAASE